MKTSLLNRFAGLCLALILTAGSAVSSNNADGKSRNNAVTQPTCINSISGLSELQKDKIMAMETQNQTVMNDLREKQHSTAEKDKKKEIKKQMDAQLETHRNSVTSVLSADQQKQFLQFQAYGANQNSQYQKQGSGKGNGGGKGSGNGKGNGSKCRM
jgi:hypothetical protein